MQQRPPVAGPPVPAPAERARTVAVRGSQPALLPLGEPAWGADPAAGHSADAAAGGDARSETRHTPDGGPGHGGEPWLIDETWVARDNPAPGPLSVDLPRIDGPESTPAEHSGERLTPRLHHVFADGSAALLFDETHPIVGAARACARGAAAAATAAVPGVRSPAASELQVALELADTAPIELRTPVRGLLWITGALHALPAGQARALAVEVAVDRPDPRLLDLGHGATLLRLRPLSLVVADAEGSHAVSPAEFQAAAPDPFSRLESGWLRHVEARHPDVLGTLSRHLPADLRGGHIRPLGLDRLGLRLRVETTTGDHDVRLAFSRPVATPSELAVEFRRMLGCPFLAAQRTD